MGPKGSVFFHDGSLMQEVQPQLSFNGKMLIFKLLCRATSWLGYMQSGNTAQSIFPSQNLVWSTFLKKSKKSNWLLQNVKCRLQEKRQ